MIRVELIVGLIAFVAAVAAAIKALPVIWHFFQNLNRFFVGMERISELPEHIDSHKNVPSILEKMDAELDGLAKMLVEHMEEEVQLREEEKQIVQDIVDIVSRQDSAVFRQTTFSSDVAYYEMIRRNGVWEFDWCNTAWSRLTGLTLDEAKTVGWDAVIADDNEKNLVMSRLERFTENNTQLDLELNIKNYRTGDLCRCRLIGYPMRRLDGKSFRYLGAMHKIVN